MCHGSNALWALDEVNQDAVEKPVAPGGATGGVEYEAMNYVVCPSNDRINVRRPISNSSIHIPVN